MFITAAEKNVLLPLTQADCIGHESKAQSSPVVHQISSWGQINQENSAPVIVVINKNVILLFL